MNQNLMDFDIGADKLREECGVFGMYDFDGNDVARTIYYGLFALQHRGQESCGIAVSDTEGPKGKAAVHKGMGLCNEVFTPEVLEGLRGNIGVGHVRYSTAGSSTRAVSYTHLDVYKRQGQSPKAEDIEINVCKTKKLTNTRSSSADEALKLTPPKIMSLEQALDFIDTDELLEVTPESLRTVSYTHLVGQ